MRRTTLILALGIALTALLAVPGALAATEGVIAQQDDSGNETAANVTAGERLSGVVSVGEAELENEVDTRTYGIKVAQAATDEAKADVVKEQLDDIEQRLDELEQRKEALDRARENGSLSEGAYNARMSGLAAKLGGIDQLANGTNRTATELPADVLESKGINVDAIRTLKDRAQELGGQEVAEIARNIAGNSVGKAPGAADVDDRVPDRAGGGDDEETDRPGTDAPDEPGDGTPTETPEAETPEDDGSDAGSPDGSDGGSDAGSDRGR